MKKENAMNRWFMTLIVFVALILLGFGLSMIFPGQVGTSITFLGTELVFSAVSLILLLIAFVLTWIMGINIEQKHTQAEGIMTIITGALLVVFAPVLGALAFVGTFFAMIVGYLGAIFVGGGFAKTVVASTAPAANTLSYGLVGKKSKPRKRKRK